MMNKWTLFAALAAACACFLMTATALPAADAAAVVPMTNPFFAMDTGLHGKHATPEGRAALLAELGYAGSDLSGTGGVAEMLKAYDAKGLRLFALYIGVSIDPDSKLDEAGLKKAAEALKGRDAWFWVAVSSRKYKCSDPAGDDDAAAVLGKLADLAAPFGVRVALYPHTGSWVERVEDAVRVAKKVDRKNIGATFNLCHFLQVDSPKNLEAALKAAAPSLFAVTISGADNDAKGWDKLIQTLDRGTFNVTPGAADAEGGRIHRAHRLAELRYQR